MQRFLIFMGWLVAAGIAVVFGLIWFIQQTAPVRLDQPFAVAADGTIQQGSGIVARAIPMASEERIRLPLVNPQTSAESVSGSITLHFTQTNASKLLVWKVVSIQGDVADGFWSDAQTLTVDIMEAVPDSYTVLEVDAPPGYFDIPWTVRLGSALAGFSQLWLILAIVLMAGMLWYIQANRRQARWKGTSLRPTVPANLSLMELALLHHATVRPADLMAELYHLAVRGYLQIVEEEKSVMFFRTKKEEGLQNYERNLLLLLFPGDTHLPSRLQDVLLSINQELFSAVVSQIYVDIYDGFMTKNYTNENPRFLHLRNKTVAIFIEILGLLTTVLALVFFGSTPGLIIVGLSVYLAGSLLYQAAADFVPLTRLSRDVLTQLADFANYLRSPKPIGPEGGQGDLFYELVPYALVMDCAQAWRERFRGIRWYIPDWYEYADAQLVDPDGFTQRIEAAATELSNAMSKVVDPNVD